MKRRVFELSKNEQRVVLIIMFMLLALAFIGYEHRLNRVLVQPISVAGPTPSPSPVETEDDQ
jgi:hypothetical protein